jgi:oxygen-independent coproporphyrinogen III oxidase
MGDYYSQKDNEFVAWYPLALCADQVKTAWQPRRAAYYVHIPFCTAICDYCGFAVEKKKGADVGRYLSALRLEIESYAESNRLSSYRFACGHFGGGTPSAIEAEELIAVKRLIDSLFDVAPDTEVTVEVNPISFTLPKAHTYFEGGVNRISFGVQSFQNRILNIIGRPHGAHDVEETLRVIRQVGWDDYSLDIIYGVPGETMDELRDDLLRAVDSGASHVSCFRLEIIPFTALKLREAVHLIPPRLSIEDLNNMDDLVAEILTGNGYRRYGAFNFARPGYESVYNNIAFVAPQAEYIGFGNSSYSYINQHVYCNYADLESYEEAVFAGRDPIALAKKASAMEVMSRYFVLGVKFFRVPRAPFIEQFGLEPEEVFGDILARLTKGGMLILEADDYVLTEAGRHYVNNVSKEFFTGENRGRRQYAQFVPNLSPEQIDYYVRLKARSSNPGTIQATLKRK